MSVELPEWTQVELTSRRSAKGQRVIAAALAITGVIGVGLSFLMMPMWWAVVLMLLTCAFIATIGVSLWFNATMNADATAELLVTGTKHSAPVLSAEEIPDDGVVYRLTLRLPADAAEPVTVQHQCSDGLCVTAGRAAPRAEVPVLVDAASKAWGVVHGPLGS